MSHSLYRHFLDNTCNQKAYPPLDDRQKKDLCRQWNRETDSAALRRLAIDVIGFVHPHIEDMLEGNAGTVALEDLENAAFQGILEGVQGFASLSRDGRQPLSLEKSALADARRAVGKCLEDYAQRDDGTISADELPPLPDFTPCDIIRQIDMRQTIEALDKLNQKEKISIRHRYGIGEYPLGAKVPEDENRMEKNFKEIAEAAGITQEQAGQNVCVALRKMRYKTIRDTLKDFREADEYYIEEPVPEAELILWRER